MDQSLPQHSIIGTPWWLQRECAGLCMPCLYVLIYALVVQGTYSAPTNLWVWTWCMKLEWWEYGCMTVACVTAVSPDLQSEACVLCLPAIADLPRWVTEMVWWFGPVRGTWSTTSPVGSIGMVRCQWMYLWNVCESWIKQVSAFNLWHKSRWEFK